MKIVSLPGVGFHTDKSKYDKFAKYLGDNLNCESEIFYWKHDWPLPSDITLPFKDTRLWIYEVILDFQQVALHAFDMQLPKADYYIGHSAGSILALAQKDVSCITFGSPAVLLECIHRSGNGDFTMNARMVSTMRSKKNIYNIINKYDQLAYYIDLPNVENYVFQGPWYNPITYEPLEAHVGYWDNKDVLNNIVTTIKKWESEKYS